MDRVALGCNQCLQHILLEGLYLTIPVAND
jgi:hypothetical protein